jgi:hypothetical protein
VSVKASAAAEGGHEMGDRHNWKTSKQLQMSSAVQQCRREFLKLAVGVGLNGWVSRAQQGSSGARASALFEGYAISPRGPKGRVVADVPDTWVVQEATLTQPTDGVYWLLFGESKRMVGKFSHDHGRTWSETRPLNTVDGKGIVLERNNAHHSLVRLKSEKLGLIYGGPYARTGRDGTVLFRSSEDGGNTWSLPVVIEPLFALCRTGSVRVLRSGRIVAPTLKWISPAAGPESEAEDLQMVFSWIYYSDDEGKTWQRSLSELFISLDGGEHGFYSFDEPVLEELNDGSLLMIARTQLGRPYQSVSKDGGISWSAPKAMDLASSPSPHTLIRIPGTGDLLLVWNQASTEECLNGLMRHRLSTAISGDGGRTWKHFRNLESLDDRSHLDPPPPQPKVYLMKNWQYIQPADRQRYPHAPGCLRVSYPTVAFWKNELAIAYDYGYGGPGELKDGSATKIKIVSRDWLYGKPSEKV